MVRETYLEVHSRVWQSFNLGLLGIVDGSVKFVTSTTISLSALAVGMLFLKSAKRAMDK